MPGSVGNFPWALPRVEECLNWRFCHTWWTGSGGREDIPRTDNSHTWCCSHVQVGATSETLLLSFGTFYHLPQRRRWHPTPVLLPGKSHGWRSLVHCSPGGRKESDMTERLHFYFSVSGIGEGNGNPLQCSCLENPRDGAAWWAAVYGVAQSQTRLKWLSSSNHLPHALTRPVQSHLSAVPCLSASIMPWTSSNSEK